MSRDSKTNLGLSGQFFRAWLSTLEIVHFGSDYRYVLKRTKRPAVGNFYQNTAENFIQTFWIYSMFV